MKTNLLKFTLLLLIICGVPSHAQSLKKRITDTDFRYEFFTSLEDVNIRSGRIYYWFKAGAIHQSEAGASGELLEGQFEKFFLSNQLAEKGLFDGGLKNGEWKSWYSDGTLAEKIQYSQGQLHGSYIRYNPGGQLVEDGQYRRNQKHGRWINYISKDTIHFKHGAPAVGNSWFYKLMRKKSPEQKAELKQQREDKKVQSKLKSDAQKQDRLIRKQKSANSPEAKTGVGKSVKNFFKRIFSPKPKDK